MVQGQDFSKERVSHKAFARGLSQTFWGHEISNFLNYQTKNFKKKHYHKAEENAEENVESVKKEQ